jgi:hypothetical protein
MPALPSVFRLQQVHSLRDLCFGDKSNLILMRCQHGKLHSKRCRPGALAPFVTYQPGIGRPAQSVRRSVSSTTFPSGSST